MNPTDYDYDADPPQRTDPIYPPEVERSRRRTRKLYGPDGRVLRTYSNRPPVGFHQGERGQPR